MSVRRRIVPQILPLLLLFFVVSAATDDLELQNSFSIATPILKQALRISVQYDSERHAWKTPIYATLTINDALLSHLTIKTYFYQNAGTLIPSSPTTFYQSNRAPPVSFL